MKVYYGSTLLALRGGGCPISKKKHYVRLEWPQILVMKTISHKSGHCLLCAVHMFIQSQLFLLCSYLVKWFLSQIAATVYANNGVNTQS